MDELDDNRILMGLYWMNQKKIYFEGNAVDESEKKT
jgi:hypothetical protein